MSVKNYQLFNRIKSINNDTTTYYTAIAFKDGKSKSFALVNGDIYNNHPNDLLDKNVFIFSLLLSNYPPRLLFISYNFIKKCLSEIQLPSELNDFFKKKEDYRDIVTIVSIDNFCASDTDDIKQTGMVDSKLAKYLILMIIKYITNSTYWENMIEPPASMSTTTQATRAEPAALETVHEPVADLFKRSERQANMLKSLKGNHSVEPVSIGKRIRTVPVRLINSALLDNKKNINIDKENEEDKEDHSKPKRKYKSRKPKVVESVDKVITAKKTISETEKTNISHPPTKVNKSNKKIEKNFESIADSDCHDYSFPETINLYDEGSSRTVNSNYFGSKNETFYNAKAFKENNNDDLRL